jgi:hypothetical protein
MTLKETLRLISAIAVACGTAHAANLADPAVLIPPARLSIGASYDLGGNSITNGAVPSIMNRVQARLSYSPFPFLNFGIDGGTTQMDVASDTTATDTFGVFHGGYGLSGGGHLKLGTPFFFNNVMSLIGIVQGNVFSSKNGSGTTYGGTDAAGALGFQFHVPGFGYVTAGSEAYLIEGKTTDYTGKQGAYSNVNNVRGWLAVDYFPPENLGTKNLLYVSLELTVGPKVQFNARAPVQEFGFSVSIGTITPRLYGQESDMEWKP